MAIVIGGSAAILVTPIRDVDYGTWASVFTAHGVFGDRALPTLLDPLAWYLIITPLILTWHMLDIRYITCAPTRQLGTEHLCYRAMLLALCVCLALGMMRHMAIFAFKVGFHNVVDDGLWWAPTIAFYALCACVLERALRAITYGVRRVLRRAVTG
ncbi:hypothetical protein QH494_24520 [Sphingomonas sp. AR_OL41]|uniref:hypothetical protein n=1 Tax=Sphingomonas sp. AR_OL41 TaxID=3042729 RepID=UPI002480554C|nr:hypothetical protein [Sphingomonas sp. AR_OL41]MDH7975364.1 hypothetical protein [Sphingomonas sp. AR_OL41]